MKGTELDYANNLKKAFQSVHIFISSDTEEDVEIIKNTLGAEYEPLSVDVNLSNT